MPPPKDQAYIVDLCDEVLGLAAKREHRFDFLLVILLNKARRFVYQLTHTIQN
jgi:hypothetical protein